MSEGSKTKWPSPEELEKYRLVIFAIGTNLTFAPTWKDWSIYQELLASKDIGTVFIDYTVFVNNPSVGTFEDFITYFKRIPRKKRVFLFFSDLMQLSCSSGKIRYEDSRDSFPVEIYAEEYDQQDLGGKISYLEGYGILIPELNFQFDTGTKKYALLPKFRELMLRTLIYPYEEKKIEKLEEGEYMIKFGLTSSMQGVKSVEGNGKEVNKRIKWILKNSKRELATACKDNIALIQPKVNLFLHCNEYRFLVVNGQIIGLFHGSREPVNVDPGQVNERIIAFVRHVISCLEESYPGYFFARIDIITNCLAGKSEVETVQERVELDLLNKDFSGEIYLNEVEPLGSGIKSWSCLKFKNPTQVEYVCEEGETNYPHEIIAEQLLLTIEEKLSALFKKKYEKYRSKYHNLKISLLGQNQDDPEYFDDWH